MFLFSGQDDDYDDYEYDDDYEYEYVDDCEDPDDDGYCETDDDYVYPDDEVLTPQFGEDTMTVRVDMGNTARITCTVHDLGTSSSTLSFAFSNMSPKVPL